MSSCHEYLETLWLGVCKLKALVTRDNTVWQRCMISWKQVIWVRQFSPTPLVHVILFPLFHAVSLPNRLKLFSHKFHWKIIWERKRIIISFVWKSNCKNLSRAFNNPFVSTRYRIYYVHPFFNLWTNKCSLNKFYYYRLLLIKIKNWRLLKNLSVARISTHLHPEIEKLNDNNHNENFFCKKMQSPAIKMIGKLKIIVFLHVYYFTL